MRWLHHTRTLGMASTQFTKGRETFRFFIFLRWNEVGVSLCLSSFCRSDVACPSHTTPVTFVFTEGSEKEVTDVLMDFNSTWCHIHSSGRRAISNHPTPLATLASNKIQSIHKVTTPTVATHHGALSSVPLPACVLACAINHPHVRQL